MSTDDELRAEDADEAKTDEDMDADEASASDTDGGEDADGEADSGDEEGQESEEEAPLEPKELPNRTTRGRRMAQALDAEEDEADNTFWAQDFFAEEQKDDSYEESSEDEDVPDSDFDKDVSSESEEEREEQVKKVKRPGGKKELLPGYKQAAQRLARRAAKVRAQRERQVQQGKREPSQGGDEVPEADAEVVVPKEAKRARFAVQDEPPEPPSLRKSTLQRTQDDESRRRREERKPVARKKNGKAAGGASHLTLGRVIDDAVHTEFENQHSLQRLLAQEEEVKAKANIVRRVAHGPRIRWRSARGSDGAASNTLQLVDMLEVPLDELPAGLKRHYERPVRGDEYVVSGGVPVPRTRRLVNDALAPSASTLHERRLYLMSGEDVTDVRKFGPLYNLPWGGSIVHQVVYE